MGELPPSEDDLERALEKEMDKMQSTEALEKEMDNLQSTASTQEDIKNTSAEVASNMASTMQEGIQKDLEKEMDKMQSTEDDIEKALEKEMDKMQSTEDKWFEIREDLETTTEEDDIETALDRELDSAPQAPSRPQTELDEDDLEKELERAMDELNDVEMRAAEGGEDDGHVQTPSKEAKEKPSPTSTKKSPQKDHFVDESRFMEDKDGNRIYKWKVDYASRGGGGRAMCRDKDCLERGDQAGVASIEKGALRICRRIQVPEGDLLILWYHARCIFNSFHRSRKSTRVIESTDDLEGFDAIRSEDQDLLRKIIAGHEDLRTAKFRSDDRGVQGNKRGAEEPAVTAAKRRREEEKVKKQVDLRKGNRCWTFVNVRFTDRDGELKSKKSSRPELGLIVEEEDKDGCFRIQFESKEHETERLEMMTKKRYRRLSAWLRYPRVFEGPPQKVPANFIRKDRPPPLLCGCKLQEWAHGCPCSGITCTRGSTQKVWGVGQ